MTPVDSLDTLILMGLQGRGGEGEGPDRREALLRQGHLRQELRGHDPPARRVALRLPDDRRRAPAEAGRGPGHASAAGFRFPHRHALHVRQPQDRARRRARARIPPRSARSSWNSARSRKLTDKPIFYDKAKNALVQLYKRRSKLGLVGEEIDVETGEWISPRQPRRRRHRLLLRVPAQVLAALRRQGLREHVARKPESPERASRRRRPDRPLVRPGGHEHGQAHGHGVRRAARLPSRRPGARRRPPRTRSASKTRASRCGTSTASSPRSSTTGR